MDRQPVQKTGGLVEPLTRRELEILALLASGRSNAEIAESLNLALSSVKWYAQQIYTKLAVDNRKQAVASARALGLLETPRKQDAPASGLPSGTVTFLFTDIEGSTPLWEQMPEAMRVSVAQHHAILRDAIEANGGQVFQVIGDAFQVAFRLAGEGLCAALAAQRALQAAQWGPTGALKVRMGLHTGPAELDGGPDAPYQVGHTLNRAARVMSAGYGGQVLLSQESADLVERELPNGVRLKDLGEHHLKGMERTEHLYQAAAQDLPQAFPSLPTAILYPNNLPVQLTSFIGREKEIDEVTGLLQTHRLLTVTGSGGVGKTSLALQVGGHLLDAFPDGVWLIELAPLDDPDIVVLSAAYALGMRDTPSRNALDILAGYLREKRLLLILDNCEHLIEACARLADTLLRGCPKLTLLATSREALGVRGETTYRLPSLAFPNPQQIPPLEDLARVEAVRLFCERAAAVQPVFTLTSANASSVGQICRRLDGIPLAIELAAARMRMATAEQIAARLDDAFRLLTGGSRTALPRQQTLKAAIDWSYNLLPEAEKVLLSRLSVFAGGWTLEAAEQVCSDPQVDSPPYIANTLEAGEIFDLLGHLVDKSLVTLELEETGAGRYSMLETVRQYAWETLKKRSGGSRALRDRHLAYFLQFALEAEPHLRSQGQAQWLDRLEEELDNLRLAMEWGLSERVVEGLQLANAILYLFHIHGHSTEGLAWYTKLLSAEALLPEKGEPGERDARRLARARGLWRHVFFALNHTDLYVPQKLIGDLEESAAILRELGSIGSSDLAYDLIYLGRILLETTQAAAALTQAAAVLEEGMELARKLGDRFLIAECLWNESNLPYLQGDIERSETMVKERLALLREVDDQDGIGSSLGRLGIYALFRGEYARVTELIDESRMNAQSVKNQWILGYIYQGYSLLTRAQGEVGQAAEWAEKGEAAFQALNEKNSALVGRYLAGMAAWAAGDYLLATRRANEVLAMAEAIGPGAPLHLAHHLLGRTALSQGALVEAQQHLEKMLIARSSTLVKLYFPPVCNDGNPLDTAYLLEALAVLAGAQGSMPRAVTLFAAIADWETRFAGLYCPRERSEHQAALAAARQALGAEAFAAAWQAGRHMSLEQALAQAKAGWMKQSA